MENNELSHWGIKGMKWGFRRYQNKDGSLTPAGKKRYDDALDSESKKSSSKNTESPEVKRERVLKSTDPKVLYKNRHLLTDAEIHERLNRINIERHLKAEMDRVDIERTVAVKQAIAEKKAAKRAKFDKVIEVMDNTVKIGKGLSNIYELTDTPAGKALKKALGLKVEGTKKFKFDEAVRDMDDLSPEAMSRLEKEVALKLKLKALFRDDAEAT